MIPDAIDPIEDALRYLDQAESCERRGMVYRDSLGRAADALRRAGMPEQATIAEEAVERIGGDESDVAELRDGLIAALLTRAGELVVIGDLAPLLGSRRDD